ncbi:MAG: LTA synthase family protein [Clostridia bacterium]|nr:LTA synthase family protein [Clostridia bacterium]
MAFIAALVAGIIICTIDVVFFRKNKKISSTIFTTIADIAVSILTAITISDIYYKCSDGSSFFPLSSHPSYFPFIFFAVTLLSGFIWIFLSASINSVLYCRPEDEKTKKKFVLKIVSLIFTALGTAALTGTLWGKETFGDLSPDQMIINIFSPTEGTSDDIMNSLWTGPVFRTVAVTIFASIFIFSTKELFYKNRNKEKKIFSSLAKKITNLVLSLALLIGGCTFGIVQFDLITLLKMYVIDESFIEDNYVHPEDIKLQFPEKKRNLIHIYLESMENSYASTDMGGYMEENLIKPLTDLAEEGYVFSNNPDGLGGPVATTGCTWSVAAMVNMNGGIPMKVTTGGNQYGAADNFMPGAITLGDILESQGYEQSLMFGASAKFGGLNFFYESHGKYNILDYNAAKEKGWIPKNYQVWWGYEDDKLYEYAKDELTRLHGTGKPFCFIMETADTHFPDGYVGPNTPTPRDSQYANVIAYSASETVKFVRWIQEQPFYENTTIVLIGDHLSMDTKFFENFSEDYLRTTFNLILNPAPSVGEIPEEKLHNRWWYNADMFPTILAGLGVKIEGDRLALGTNLFSDTPTLFEEHGGEKGWNLISKKYKYKSDFYNENILKGNNEPFDTKNVTEY